MLSSRATRLDGAQMVLRTGASAGESRRSWTLVRASRICCVRSMVEARGALLLNNSAYGDTGMQNSGSWADSW